MIEIVGHGGITVPYHAPLVSDYVHGTIGDRHSCLRNDRRLILFAASRFLFQMSFGLSILPIISLRPVHAVVGNRVRLSFWDVFVTTLALPQHSQ